MGSYEPQRVFQTRRGGAVEAADEGRAPRCRQQSGAGQMEATRHQGEGLMNDVEARAFVVHAIAEGFRLGNPTMDAESINKNCRDIVNVVIDNYLKLRYLTDEQPISGKERAS